MVPKGTPQEIINKLAEAFPRIFAHKRVKQKMKQTGSPLHIMTREEVQAMWKARQGSLEELLKGL